MLAEEAAALEEQAPRLAARAVELTKQLQKEEEVRCHSLSSTPCRMPPQHPSPFCVHAHLPSSLLKWPEQAPKKSQIA